MLTPSSGTLADYNNAVLDGRMNHVRIVFPVQNITLTESNISGTEGIQILDILNSDIDLVMGQAVSREIRIIFLNSSVFSGFDWTEEFHVDFGVDISGVTNWVTIGYFKGMKPEKVIMTDTIEFTAYDSMTLFDQLADDFISTISFPATMEDIYHDLCTYIGVGYSAGDEIADCMAISYAENPLPNGYSCRSILEWIAEANCCYAKIDSTGNVRLTWFTDHTSDYSLDGDKYFSVDIDDGPVIVPDSLRIVCTTQDGVNMLYPLNGADPYEVLDNPFMLAAVYSERVAYITETLNRFNSVGAYYPCKLVPIGNWMVETGDIIEIDIEGTTYTVPIFTKNFYWNGGCSEEYACTGQLERSTWGSHVQEQYEEGAKFAQKYDVQSGIDITDDGITVSGGKWIKLISGGVLDVQATNFVIDSTDRLVQIGDWEFNENGLVLRELEEWQGVGQYNTALMAMRLGSDTLEADETSALYIDRGYTFYNNYNSIASTLTIGSKVWSGGVALDYWKLRVGYINLPGEAIPNFKPGNHPAIIPDISLSGNWVLGDSSSEFAGAFIEKFFGDVTFRTDGYFTNETTGRYARYNFVNNSANLGGGDVGGTIRLDFGNATNQTSNRMVFFEYSPKSTPDAGNTGYSEGYRLPAPTAGLTASANYDILTTKNTVTIAQGGTGATTASAARTALGLGAVATKDTVPVANGGTGATSASDARTNLGLGAAATRAVANNLTTTASGYVLDARQGKTLKTAIDKIEIVTMTGKMGSSTNTDYNYAIPNSEDGSTMAIVAYSNLNKNNSAWYGNNSDVKCEIAGANVRFNTSASAFTSSSFKVMLIKYVNT